MDITQNLNDIILIALAQQKIVKVYGTINEAQIISVLEKRIFQVTESLI